MIAKNDHCAINRAEGNSVRGSANNPLHGSIQCPLIEKFAIARNKKRAQISREQKGLQGKKASDTLRRSAVQGGTGMPFCKACGQELGTATICPKCGASQGAATPPVAAAPQIANVPATAGMDENVAGLLCYVLGWVTGIIFLLIDKRPFVRFHAAQSIVVFGGLFILRLGLGFMAGMMGGGVVGWGVLGMIGLVVGLLGLV